MKDPWKPASEPPCTGQIVVGLYLHQDAGSSLDGKPDEVRLFRFDTDEQDWIDADDPDYAVAPPDFWCELPGKAV